MARRFVFELEAVLEQRRRAERRAQALLAEVQRERGEVEAQLGALGESVEAERNVTRGLMVGRVSAWSLREHVAGEMGADRKARALAVRLAGVQHRVERARELLRQAAVQRQAIERLRERRWRAWQAEMEKAERQEQDDIALMRRGYADGAEG